MKQKVIKIEIKVTRTMVAVITGLLLVALALLAVTSAGARPPLEGPGGQGEVTVASTVPTMISYQGQLLDSGGNPVPTGTYTVTFKLYNAPTGGTLLWSETQSVMVTDGLFNVLLGEYVSLISPEGELYPIDDLAYLGVTVGSDPEMTPRQRMVSVPFAFRAEKAKSDDDWDGAGTGKMYTHFLTDNIGIGTAAPKNKLDVAGGVAVGEGYAGTVTAPTNGMAIKGKVAIGEWVPDEALRVKSPDYSTPIFGAYNRDGNRVLQIESPNWNTAQVRLGGLIDSVAMFTDLLVGDDDYSGKVGIGTLTPRNKLDVAGAVAIGTDYSGTATAPADGMVIEGNVGIGTSNPTAKLEVNGDIITPRVRSDGGTAGPLRLEANGALVLTADRNNDDANQRINFYINGEADASMKMTILENGNVGIGTTDASGKLTVQSQWPTDWITLQDASDPNYKWHIHNPQSTDRLEIGVSSDGIDKWGLLTINRTSGNVGIGTTEPDAKLTIKGDGVILKGYNTSGDVIFEMGEGLDYSEAFPTSQDEITPGTVMVIDPANKGLLTISTQAYDKKVAGIVAGANGLGSGVRLGSSAGSSGEHAVALAGRVYCNVDTQYGDIEPGDLLTTSPTPGHAMVVKDFSKAQGVILGKAMEGLSGGGKGQILVLVTLQ
jgi:hypothetical protein